MDETDKVENRVAPIFHLMITKQSTQLRSAQLKAIVMAMALFYLGGRAICAEALAPRSEITPEPETAWKERQQEWIKTWLRILKGEQIGCHVRASRFIAVDILGEIGKDRAIEVLRNLRYILSGERRDWDVIYRAEDFLRAEEVLSRHISSKREDVTKTKSQWLDYLSRRTNLWVDLLFNEGNEIPVRRLALEALGEIKGQKQLEAIRKFARTWQGIERAKYFDYSASLRKEAIEILYRINRGVGREVIKFYTKILRNRQAEAKAQTAAVYILADLAKPYPHELAERPLIVRLIQILASENEALKKKAAEAIFNIGSITVDFLVAALDKPALQKEAQKILIKFGAPVVAPLIKAAKDNDKSSTVRARAQEALGEISDPGAFHLLVKALSDPDEIVQKQALKAAKAMAFEYRTGTESLEKHYGLYQCDVELTKFLKYLLNNFPLEKEWTLVKEVNMEGEGGTFFRMVIDLLHIKAKPVSQWRLNWIDLRDHLYIRNSDRSLFLEKGYDVESYIAERFPYPVQPDRNNPFREELAFRIGRLIGANTAECVSPSSTQTLSALSCTTAPDSLPQKTKEGAEAATLVFNIFIRKWDDSKEMIQRSRVGKTFVSFDHDQAFNSAYKDFKRYLEVFVWFASLRHYRWDAKDFDAQVIWHTIQLVKGLDVDSLVSSIPGPIPPRMDHDALALFLKHTQGSIEEDVKAVYKTLTGGDLEDVIVKPSSELVETNL